MMSNEKGLTPSFQEGTSLQEHSEQQKQFITFTIGEEEYAVDIMVVREIKAWSETTHLPNTPEFMRGVLNLRGLIVPIFDLRCRFGLGLTETTKMHVIIIVRVENRLVGILVDTVSDIIKVTEGEIQEVPKMDRNIDDEYLRGLVTVSERMVALLDVDRLFNPQAIETGIAMGEAASGEEK